MEDLGGSAISWMSDGGRDPRSEDARWRSSRILVLMAAETYSLPLRALPALRRCGGERRETDSGTFLAGRAYDCARCRLLGRAFLLYALAAGGGVACHLIERMKMAMTSAKLRKTGLPAARLPIAKV